MGIFEWVFGVILLLFSVGIIVVVLLQEAHQQNSGAIMGGSSDTYLSKNKSRTKESKLANLTKFVALGFFVMVIAINIYMFFSA